MKRFLKEEGGAELYRPEVRMKWQKGHVPELWLWNSPEEREVRRPWGPASWGFTGEGIGLSRERSFTGAGGWGLLGTLKMPILASEKGWFYHAKMKDLSGGRIPGPGGSPTGSRGGFRRSSGELLGPPEWSKSDEN